MNDENCVICSEPKEYSLQILKCGHTFHVRCIQTWFDRNSLNSCPLCRNPNLHEPTLKEIIVQSPEAKESKSNRSNSIRQASRQVVRQMQSNRGNNARRAGNGGSNRGNNARRADRYISVAEREYSRLRNLPRWQEAPYSNTTRKEDLIRDVIWYHTVRKWGKWNLAPFIVQVVTPFVTLICILSLYDYKKPFYPCSDNAEDEVGCFNVFAFVVCMCIFYGILTMTGGIAIAENGSLWAHPRAIVMWGGIITALWISAFIGFIVCTVLLAGGKPVKACSGSENGCRAILWEHNLPYALAMIMHLVNTLIFSSIGGLIDMFCCNQRSGGLFAEPETLQRVLNLNFEELNRRFG